MVREELMSLCDAYVRSRDSGASPDPGGPADPSPEILRSFRLAEISECEMEALLSYVGNPDDEYCSPVMAFEQFDEDLPLPEWDDDGSLGPCHPR